MAKRGSCSKCKREKMTIVARGLCGKCYQDFRKEGSSEPARLTTQPLKDPEPCLVGEDEPLHIDTFEKEIGSLQTGINDLINERNKFSETNKVLRKELIEAVGKIRELKKLVDENLDLIQMPKDVEEA